MSNSNILTDLTALKTRRARARQDALFLQELAADDLQDRLSMVNRAFKSPAVVTPFSRIWQSRLPGAKVVSDSETLDLNQGAHDLVIHSLGLHWSNDPVGQLIQCRNALMPDGMLIVAALGGQTLHELRSVLGQAEVTLTGGLSPRIAPMGEIRDLGALLQRAGLALPVADSFTTTAEYRDMAHLMQDLRAMGESNALQARHRIPTPRALFQDASQLYVTHFQTKDGRIPATFEMVILTGWAPDQTQPKPLRPGSAQQRLADALSTKEKPLPD